MSKDSVAVQGIRYASRSGFTLIELLLVIAILGVLAGIVAANLTGKGDDARRETTRASIAAIKTAVGMYEVANSTLPESMDQLTTPDGERPPILDKNRLNDGWGHPFQYKKTGKYTYEIRSAGVDGNMGTDDDLLD